MSVLNKTQVLLEAEKKQLKNNKVKTQKDTGANGNTDQVEDDDVYGQIGADKSEIVNLSRNLAQQDNMGTASAIKGRTESDAKAGMDDDRQEAAAEQQQMVAEHRQRKSVIRGNFADWSAGNGAGDAVDTSLAHCKVVRKMDEKMQSCISSILKKELMFQDLGMEEMKVIMAAMQPYKIEAGQLVFSEGDQGDTFFVTEEGELDVSCDGNSINTIQTGEGFGTTALSYRCTRTATVTANTPALLWGAPRETCHAVIREHSEKHLATRRKILDKVRLFAKLPERDKDMVACALTYEVYEAGQVVVADMQTQKGLYIVQSGALNVTKGGEMLQKVVSDKVQCVVAVGGTVLETFTPAGDNCCGEQTIQATDRQGEMDAQGKKLVANEKTEVLSISKEYLERVLGSEVQTCVDRDANAGCFSKSPFFSMLVGVQSAALLEAMTCFDLSAEEEVEESYLFLSVIDGQVSLMDRATMRQGALSEGQLDEIDMSINPPKARTSKIVAGPDGARVGLLKGSGVVEAFNSLGITDIKDSKQAVELLPKICLASKVPMFRNMSQQQLCTVAKAMQERLYGKGDKVMSKGEIGTTLFVVHLGVLDVRIDGKTVNTMGRNDFFGERALIKKEPRSADVVVASEDAQVWNLEADSCWAAVSETMKVDLQRRLELQYDADVELKMLKHVKVIGHSDFGVVRLVECAKSGVFYSLKRLAKLGGKLPEEAKREKQTSAEVAHPFVVHVVKQFETPNNYYILSELITGGSFRAALDRRSLTKKYPGLTHSEAQFYIGCITLVLEVMASKRVLHRDLKPENILLDNQGYPKVISFTCAKQLKFKSSRSFTLFGTPHYMAPEVFLNKGYSVEVDLWAAGIITYELMADRLPFGQDAANPRQVWDEIMNGKLTFPDSINKCEPAKNFIQGLLTADPKCRLGGGTKGVDDMKRHEFFTLSGQHQFRLFEELMGRDKEAPLQPKKMTARMRGLLGGHAKKKQTTMGIARDITTANEEEGLFSDADELWTETA